MQVVGQLPEEGDFLLLCVPDSTGYLDHNDTRGSLDAQEVWVPDKVLGCMLADEGVVRPTHEDVVVVQDLIAAS